MTTLVIGFRIFARFAAACAILLGSVAFATRIASIGHRATPGVDLGLILSGISLLLRIQHQEPCRTQAAAVACALVAAALGLIDMLGFAHATGAAVLVPTTPATGALLLITGISLSFLDSEDRYGSRPAQAAALVVALFTIVACGASILAKPADRAAAAGPFLSAPAAVGFLFLSLGALAARPDKGWVRVITVDAVGGEVARRLLPPAVLAPVALLIVCYLGFVNHWYDSSSGLILLTTLNSAALTVLVWRAAVALNSTDARRKAMEAERNELNAKLQRSMAETHHRVRNNLQIISALADMQVMSGNETVPVSELKRISGQVQALAAVHDILTHETKQDAAADTVSAEEVLTKLAGLLQQTIQRRSIVVRAEPARITGRQASALVVVANELITNALKNSSGDVSVGFTAAEGTGRLTVQDHGPGFPPGFNPSTDSNTGLDLVQQIARWDLQGTIEFANPPEGGARVTVEMPLASPVYNAIPI